jgi:methionine synthase II (cobalamin-independent)
VLADLRGKFYPTAVGSLPYKDSRLACEKVLGNFKDVPFWPQLVRRSFLENMYVQFSQNLPGVVVDSEEKRIYVNTQRDLSGELEVLYEKFLNDEVDFFSIGRDYAEGLYTFTEILQASGAKPKFLKGHITGPVSFGLTVTDEKRRSLFYNPELREALVKTLSMKARWQIRKLKTTGINCMFFIDEPYLTSIGSSFVSLNRDDALISLNEVIQAVHKEGALCGMHCCGNTDWGFILTTDIDILSFDAYNFYESVPLYLKELKGFLKKGGILAWGIIPNTQEIIKINYNSLDKKLEMALGLFEEKGVKKEDILDSMIVTPSCGLGLVEEYISDIVMENKVEFSNRLKKIYN